MRSTVKFQSFLKFLTISILQKGLYVQHGLHVQQYEYVRRMVAGSSVPVCVCVCVCVCLILFWEVVNC
jgi:hypothetical protein